MSPTPTSQRKLCVRHQRMADEGTNLKLQQVCFFSIPPSCSSSHIFCSLLMLSPYKNENLSIPSGLASPPHPIPEESLFSKDFSPCAVFLNSPYSQSSLVS
jgi:hypothetical protein